MPACQVSMSMWPGSAKHSPLGENHDRLEGNANNRREACDHVSCTNSSSSPLQVQAPTITCMGLESEVSLLDDDWQGQGKERIEGS